MRFVNGIRAARERIVARKDEDREDFLRKRGFSKAESAKIVATVLSEEGRPPESIYDFVQGITAFARTKTHQDRSEEHTSELQSLMRISYAVFCLKKKTTHTHKRSAHIADPTQHNETTQP